MVSEQLSTLKRTILEEGTALVGFADLNGLVPEKWEPLTSGISLAVRLSNAIIDEIKTTPTDIYANHYHILNAMLDNIALRTANLLQSWGYSALPFLS
ncbi:MAG: hypothetical protein ACE5OZ_01885 [Candidatus Heimdallarchaeota archaeon]